MLLTEFSTTEPYVRLVDVMGSDLSVINAAKASFNKESKIFGDQEVKLINYLVKHGHLSPFRHCFMSFELKAPLCVARQIWKYVVGSDHTMDGWNEKSYRYCSFLTEKDFFIPETWRYASPDVKQGSGLDISKEESEKISETLKDYINMSIELYQFYRNKNIAPELARLFLPANSLYTTWRWSASLQSIGHFLNERLDNHAQAETRQYASLIHKLAYYYFPISIEALLNGIVQEERPAELSPSEAEKR